MTGYRIYYQEVDGTRLGPLLEREPRIPTNRTSKAKLAGLKPHSKYRVTIKATTIAGEGMPYYTECDTNPQALVPPSRPKFKFSVMNNENGLARIKVTWQPQIEGNPGSHFYVQVTFGFMARIPRHHFESYLVRCYRISFLFSSIVKLMKLSFYRRKKN